jgi:hypothetical protein
MSSRPDRLLPKFIIHLGGSDDSRENRGMDFTVIFTRRGTNRGDENGKTVRIHIVMRRSAMQRDQHQKE